MVPLVPLIVQLAWSGARYVFDKVLESDALQTLTFTARATLANLLTSYDRLNTIVDKITFGIVNKQRMGERLWRESRDILSRLPLDPKAIGSRKSLFLPTLSAVFRGDTEAMQGHLSTFTQQNLAYYFDHKAAEPLSYVASSTIASTLMRADHDPDIGEKWLARIKDEHTWTALETMMREALPPATGRDFLLRQLGPVLRTVLDAYKEVRPGHIDSYGALADLARIDLTGYRQPDAVDNVLRVAPLTAQVVSAAITASQTLATAKKTVCSLIGQIVRTVSQHLPFRASRALHEVERILNERARHLSIQDKTLVTSEFARHADTLALHAGLPTDAVTGSPPALPGQHLRTLSYLCEGNQDLIAAVTSFLHPDSVAAPLAKAALARCSAYNGETDAGDRRISVANQNYLIPATAVAVTQFGVHREGLETHVTIDSDWPLHLSAEDAASGHQNRYLRHRQVIVLGHPAENGLVSMEARPPEDFALIDQTKHLLQ